MNELIDVNNLILFHSFKHHLAYCVDWVFENNNRWNEKIRLMSNSLGNSQLDMYIGDYSTDIIKKEIYSFLEASNLKTKDEYLAWINNGNEYQEFIMSDGSKWTLRFLEREDYIHIHPSRNSKHTLRIKANVLKSVICTLLFIENWQDIDNHKINECRINKLDLSPIDIDKDHYEIKRIVKLFIDKRISIRNSIEIGLDE